MLTTVGLVIALVLSFLGLDPVTLHRCLSSGRSLRSPESPFAPRDGIPDGTECKQVYW